MVNKVILLGNCGKDPEVKHLEGGVSVAKFTLATSEKFKNKAGEVIENTEWHSVVAWRGLAEVCEKYIRKGTQLFIEGKITYRTYEDKDGSKKYFTEIVADNIRMLGGKKEEKKEEYNPAPTLPEEPESIGDIGGDDLPF